MKKRLTHIFKKGRKHVKNIVSAIKEKIRPFNERVAVPVTKWARKFERNFFATTHIARVFRKTLFIAAVFSGAGFAFGSISAAAFIATVKIATIVGGITWGRELITRAFTDKKQVTWKNEIGQEITATKIQKQKITATQTQINRLTDKFNSVSGPTKYQEDKLKIIVDEMKDFAKQVTIKSAPDGVANDRYIFVAAKKDWKALN